jgi:hypothetical protein
LSGGGGGGGIFFLKLLLYSTRGVGGCMTFFSLT